MRKKQPVPTYVAHIEAAEGGYRSVVTQDGEQVYESAVRRKQKAARLDAAGFVVGCPEKQRNLQWDDPFSDDLEEEEEVGDEEDKPGMDLGWVRNWVRNHPRFKDEQRRVIFAAMDAFEALKPAIEVSRDQLGPIVAAIRCPWEAAWDVRGDLLAELAWKHRAAQDAFRELVASRKALERFRAVLSLSARMPKSLLLELLSHTVNDRSKRVRQWTAEVCGRLMLQEMIPKLLERAQAEPDPEVKRSMEFNAALIRDGYAVERKEESRLYLYIRLPDGGLTGQDITQRDVDRGRVPAIVAKRLAERD
jgi:hypothetical protein